MMGRGPDDDIAARNFHQGECQIGSRQSEEEIYKWSLVDISSMDSINREAIIQGVFAQNTKYYRRKGTTSIIPERETVSNISIKTVQLFIIFWSK